LLALKGLEFSAELVGWGSERSRVAAKIEEYGLSRQVSISEVSLDHAADVIDSTTVSVVPSLWSEGSSLTAIESLAMGVPVVATHVGGLANVILPGFNGYITCPDANALATHIERLLADRNVYVAIARNCASMRNALSLSRWKEVIDERLLESGLITECVGISAESDARAPRQVSVPSR
jgi:glycosyltransferase involved in cell wall biosynthesis